MNLIQKEMLLKAAMLGCTVEGADAESPLEVRKDGKNICTIHSDKMTFQRGEDDALLEQLIDIYHTVQEYTTAYEKAPELKAVENYKLLSEFNGTVLAARDMKNGENAFSYAPFTETQVTELLSELRRMADYIIIDCTSNITNDVLSAVSLIESDAVLRLVSCDLKSISYLNSQLPLLLDNKFNANKQYKAASNVGDFQADENVEQVVGGVSFRIAHSDEVHQQFLTGNMFGALTGKESKDFRKAVSKIANEVFEL